MFCVECGREGQLFLNLCSQCYLSRNRLVTIPQVIEVEICPHCGSRKRGKGWVESDSRDIDEMVKEIVREHSQIHNDVAEFYLYIKSESEDDNNLRIHVRTEATAMGLKGSEEHDVRLRLKSQVCTECSKREGGYWEAKVQLRGHGGAISEDDITRGMDLVETLVGGRAGERGAFITKAERIHGGLDIYIGSNSLGKMIARELAAVFGGSVKESHKLMGRKDGKDVYRTTYAVRMSEFSAKEFIRIDEQVFQVQKTSRDGILLKALDSGKDIWFRFPELQNAIVIGGEELVRDMVVVSRTAGEIQVLDPDNMRTVEVLLPVDFDAGSETVRVMKCDLGYFLVE